MRKISLSTRLLIGLAALVVVLTAALLILTPPEKWTELRSLRQQYCYAGAGSPGAPDATAGTYFPPRYRFRGPHGHPPFFGLLFVIGLFVAGRFLFFRRRPDASLSILEELYAEGKIDEAEFKRKRSVLSGSRGKEE